MKGKLTVLLLLAFTIIVLIIGWFWLQDLIVKYDIDRAMAINELIYTTVENEYIL